MREKPGPDFVPAAPVPAATVILVRDAREGIEVFLMERSGFGVFGGLHVFPGGKIDPTDGDGLWSGLAEGVDPETANATLGVDSGGLDYWAGRFRTAQCLADAERTGGVYQAAIDIAAGFFNSGEYWADGVSNTQYVSDLYNAFMRRSADLEGFNYWVHELDTAAQTHEQVRQAFIDSTEFAGRVAAIVEAGCRMLTMPLNDTGITSCGDESSNGLACPVPATPARTPNTGATQPPTTIPTATPVSASPNSTPTATR